MNSNSKKNYSRLDIQGLRGVAIISVLLFHYFPKLFSMSFLGVDLFFVISGYLITSIISIKLEESKFSFKSFFLKRFCRIIIPILFIFLFFSFISFSILLPKDLNNLWNSVLATLLLMPNIFFWLTGGYFGSANEYKSFLHLWSVGLELQFYFLFPFVLTVVFKNFYNKKATLTLILSIILLIIYLLIYNTNFSFFNLPGRLWEFYIGSLVFFLPKRKKNLFLYYISLFLIFFFLLFSFKNYEFLNQFIIVLATGCVIYYNNKNFFLTNKIFIFFGKISYSLYLLHWPILVFAKYYLIRDLLYYETFFLFFFSIGASYYFWLFIEDYFRKKLLLKLSIRIIIILYGTLFIFFFSEFF